MVPLNILSIQLGMVEQQVRAIAEQVRLHSDAGTISVLRAAGMGDVLHYAGLSLDHAAQWVRMATTEVRAAPLPKEQGS